jgi:hypothetical protein
LNHTLNSDLSGLETQPNKIKFETQKMTDPHSNPLSHRNDIPKEGTLNQTNFLQELMNFQKFIHNANELQRPVAKEG